jgi:hypothetical protein
MPTVTACVPKTFHGGKVQSAPDPPASVPLPRPPARLRRGTSAKPLQRLQDGVLAARTSFHP